MIYETMNYISGALNQHLGTILGSNEERVVLSNLSALDGVPSQKANERLAMFLVNIEEESTLKNGAWQTMNRNSSQVAYGTPTLYLNLYTMFASVFSDYGESLKFLSYTLRYFQSKTEFTPDSSSAFPAGVSRLVFDLISMDYQTMSYVWGMIGLKYQPSVLYRVRLLPISSAEYTETLPTVHSLQPNVDAS